mgnify:CR=1 FL=1
MIEKKSKFMTLKLIIKTTLVVSAILITILFSVGFFNDLVKYKDYTVTKVFEITERNYSTVTLKSGKEQFTVNIDRINGVATSSNIVAMALDKNGYPVAPREVILKKLQFDVFMIGLCVVYVLIAIAIIKKEEILTNKETDGEDID